MLKLNIIRKHKALFVALLNILQDGRIIHISVNQEISLFTEVTVWEINDRCSNTLNQLDAMVDEKPQYKGHMTLLITCTKNIPKILKGELPATDVLFPESRMDLVENVYKGNISADYYNEILVSKLEEIITQKVKKLSPGDEIKILEIGAGTGGTSELVLERIQKFKQVKYFYTDISQAFIKYGRKKFSSKYDFVDFTSLNIENPNAVKNFKEQDFDIAIAANMLHATSDINNTLANTNYLLKESGHIVINELVNKKNFLTLTFGLLDGWWLFKDESVRISGTPLLATQDWITTLQAQCFNECEFIGMEEDNNPDQAIIVSTKHKNALSVEPIIVNLLEPVEQTDYTSLPDESISAAIVNVLADTLEIDPSVIEIDKAYIDYGIDSILAVEGVNEINKVLNITLRTTDFFNYVSIRDLSDYIKEKFFRKSTPTLPKETPSHDSTILQESEESMDKALLNLLRELEEGNVEVNEVDTFISKFC